MLKLDLTKTAMLIIALVTAAIGCSDDKATADDAGADHTPKGTDECPVVVSDKDCDETLRPMVFVHGTYGSGDNIANVAMLFGSNGYCQDRFVAVEYNSLGGKPDADLDKLVDSILAKTGADQVDLLGHSQGTMHCDNYLNDPARAKKVAHYINLSGEGMVPNNVPTLSLSSMNDLGGAPHHAPNAEKQVTFETQDHFGVAASEEAFAAIYEYLEGKKPKYTKIQCGDDEVTIQGISEQFGDNTRVTTGSIEVYELTADSDPQKRDKPVMTIAATSDGVTPEFKLKRGASYEFRALDADDNVIGHSYYSPFKRSNYLVRFLAPPQNPLVSLTTTSKVIVGDDHVAMVFRYLPGAFRHDLGDVLKINGGDILSDDNAGMTNITVGLFASDQNMNKMTDLGASFTAPFVTGTDVYMDATTPDWITLQLGKTKMQVPNWPSKSQGLMSVTFQED